jgi:GT2 family glycosyltransferase
MNDARMNQDDSAPQNRLPAAAAPPNPIGVVVIGRNEGTRLTSCLRSLRPFAERTVYVDSGSTDDSVSVARSLGVHTLQLDPARPFSAARARNEGFELLLKLFPDLQYVQFMDGDCEVAMEWPLQAAQFLRTRPDVGVVWGGQREKYPRRTLYNHLCDLEWQQGPRGEALECGGNALMRVQAFRAVRGYRSDLICGEEPELCVRLRRAGWRIWRLEAPMAKHDAAMVHFRQWWRRMRRGGYAFAQGAHLHGASPERLWISQARRAWLWGLCVPLAVILGAALFGPAALLLLLAYPLQIGRIALRDRGGDPGRRGSADRWLYATAVVLAKFPELLGHLSFRVHALTRVPARLIEYK